MRGFGVLIMQLGSMLFILSSAATGSVILGIGAIYFILVAILIAVMPSE